MNLLSYTCLNVLFLRDMEGVLEEVGEEVEQGSENEPGKGACLEDFCDKWGVEVQGGEVL